MSLSDYEPKSWEETLLVALLWPLPFLFYGEALVRRAFYTSTEDDKHRIWWRLKHLDVDPRLEAQYLGQRFRCKNSGVEHHTGWCQEHCERFRSHECSGTQASLQTAS